MTAVLCVLALALALAAAVALVGWMAWLPDRVEWLQQREATRDADFDYWLADMRRDL